MLNNCREFLHADCLTSYKPEIKQNKQGLINTNIFHKKALNELYLFRAFLYDSRIRSKLILPVLGIINHAADFLRELFGSIT